MNKNSQRFKWAAYILLAVILSSYDFFLFHVYINVGLLLFLSVGLYELLRQPFISQIYVCFSSLFTALGYTSLSLFAIYDPVWFIIPVDWVSAALLLFVCCLLCKTLIQRIIFIFIATAMGEIIFGIILIRLHLHNEIGVSAYLDRIAIAFAGIVFLTGLHTIVKSMERLVVKLKEEKRNVV